MIEIPYYGGKMILHEDHLQITPSTFLEKKSLEFGKIDSVIQFADIAGIGFRDASLMSNGFIQFAVYDKNGNFNICSTMGDTFKDTARNVFHFTRGQKNEIVKARAIVAEYLEKNGGGLKSKSSGKVDTSAQLKALNDLLSAGLITREDFDEQAKHLS